jgi:hypothetical protein
LQASYAQASGATSLGGSYASGTDSFAAAVANNTSTYGAKGANSVSFGNQSLASAQSSFSLGDSSTASGIDSFVYGQNSTASATRSIVIGHYGSSILTGKIVFSNNFIGAVGDTQFGLMILRAATTDATPKVLASEGAAGAANQVVLPNNSAFTFNILVGARQSAAGGTASASWQITGLIRREGTAASTTLVASTVTTISNVPAWTIAVTADTTNGGLAVTATGAAATNIRWVATVQSSEVTYA